MSANYSRLLRDDDLVQHFIEKVLQFRTTPKIIRKIVTSEKMLMDFKEEENTLISTKHRDRDYVSELDRWNLRERIISELYTLQRLGNEDETTLGAGGALPRIPVRSERRAFILIGPPASGKSSIANAISEDEGAIILDSDFAKRKLPEFEYDCGATLVQEESNKIVFGFGENNPQKIQSLYNRAIENGNNLVIPKVGPDPKSIIKLAETLTKIDYQVNLTLVSLKRREATIRALHRFNTTKRYVPLGYIFDQVGNDPLLTYYLVKEKGQEFFSSFGAISTDVNLNEAPECIDLKGDNPAKKYKLNQDRFF
ncbi:zeta toxin family protein [[Flexibacter] sp. ATCC 35208]|uniref:zeta toxin family protein n=1 Tax=[Flexibacter] sp. ATCC 35208 TaxID=1936242 RepID=UPI0009F8FB1A|nr:zeta toxin family protein [[Flexibacter] sp. ATCC 35208]